MVARLATQAAFAAYWASLAFILAVIVGAF
jgi:hypothetical protein